MFIYLFILYYNKIKYKYKRKFHTHTTTTTKKQNTTQQNTLSWWLFLLLLLIFNNSNNNRNTKLEPANIAYYWTIINNYLPLLLTRLDSTHLNSAYPTRSCSSPRTHTRARTLSFSLFCAQLCYNSNTHTRTYIHLI